MSALSTMLGGLSVQDRKAAGSTLPPVHGSAPMASVRDSIRRTVEMGAEPDGGAVRPLKISRRRFCLAAAGVPAVLRPRRAFAGQTDRAVVVEMVDAAVAAIDKDGFPRALHETTQQTWLRRKSGLYVFVLGQDGTLYLHPDKAMEGRNVASSRDVNGKPFIRDIIAATVAAPDRGAWTEYAWPDARTGKLGTKHTYSRLAAGFIVAAGYIAGLHQENLR